MVESLELRCLVTAPSGKDAMLIAGALARGRIASRICATAAETASEGRCGAGAILIAEEALVTEDSLKAMQALIEDQPAWSDLPVLLLTKSGPAMRLALTATAALGNVTVLERPVPMATLVSAVRTALRTRERQYLARTADRRKDEFLATLAHELRNPLAPMTNALHLLRRGDAQAEVRQWSLDVMQRQLRQMTRLIDDLLDVARISQGKVVLQRRVVDVREVVRNAIEISTPWIETMRHQLDARLPDAPVLVDADPVRLAQCISNLLNNAARYTPEGGHIVLTATCAGSQLVLEVADDGVGIAADAMHGLFRIFSQIDRSQRGSQGGLGIGLSIVKSFVEMHGGSVEARSGGLGRGSSFVIRMPVVEHCDTPAAALSAGLARHDVPPQRILVIDDNADSADTLSLLLRTCGHVVDKAYTGQAGIAAALATPPALAIIDIGLPDMSGYDVARRLREASATSDTVLVALSGWGQDIDRARSAQAGFVQHLVKPADPAVVLELIQAAAREVHP
ncbi:MAG TPA: hybrid sensor histidine kinase/response regulator [Albitalea sp.]|uniref:hybrid sensor histidine kinase/response regulator n=1 Tax=Piscinibacter sp. TaxID=1903157 RepID=UPI002ED34AEB